MRTEDLISQLAVGLKPVRRLPSPLAMLAIWSLFCAGIIAAALLISGLRADFAGYFRHPWPKDEVPPLNGDPFTDSQEPPGRIELLAAETDGHLARQPLRLVFDAGAAGSTGRLLHYQLRRDAGRWRVVDIVDEHGASLAGLLRQR